VRLIVQAAATDEITAALHAAETEEAAAVAALPTAEPAAEAAAPAAAVASYSPEQIALGQQVFSTTCSACHGMDARGVPGLGKNLLESAFVHGLSDDALLQFIIVGRDAFHPDNTTGNAMPARGGNPMVTDAQLMAVVAYLRSQSGMGPVGDAPPSGEAVAQAVGETHTPVPPTAEPTDSPTQAAPANEPGTAVPAAAVSIASAPPTLAPTLAPDFDPAAAYAWSCGGCHGLDGQGAGVAGPALQNSALMTDAHALRAFLSQQQPPLDPAIDFPHPVRGGYPELTDAQLDALIAYVQRLAGGG
jgi:mono/diheme cytochrome c family protein